jgi:uroporphyrinogen decarboxylase
MRQAGGLLPAYVGLRERHSVLQIAKTPELCAEVSVGAADALGTDGAVLFADIVLVLEAMGVALDLTDAGPMVEWPIRSEADLAGLRAVDPVADLGFVLEAIGRTRAGVAGRAGVIGILGGPFTLASYLVDGGPSRDQIRTRTLIHATPATWDALMERLTVASIAYAKAQAAAGADVIQVFDTWAGILTPSEYAAFVAPYTRRILAAVAAVDVPTVHYVARSEPILPAVAATGATVVALDSRQGLSAARDRLGDRQAVQGNLDPALVMAGWRQAAYGAAAVLAANAGRAGHVFNVGDAPPRDADPDRLRDLVRFVHDRSSHERAAHVGAPHRPEPAHAV